MSAGSPDHRDPQPASRAAELAAQQVESIVEAARGGAERLTDAARREAAEVKAQARESAQAELADARSSAIRLSEEAREEAAARISEAQAASDEALAEAKAVSSGLRQLAQLLTVNAERILRDVQNSHRAISANLRAAAGAGPAADMGTNGESAPSARTRDTGGGGGNPFDEIEPPAWVEEASPKRRPDG